MHPRKTRLQRENARSTRKNFRDFRQYFFAGDRAEMPFNRATRAFVYRLAKNEGSIIGFGSTNDLREPGSIIFVNHAFPVLEEERLPTPPLMIGEGIAGSRSRRNRSST